jgi:hypothetical protein
MSYKVKYIVKIDSKGREYKDKLNVFRPVVKKCLLKQIGDIGMMR